MALKKETIEQLKTKFKFDFDKLVAAMADPIEVEYELPVVEVLTTEELTTRDTNVKVAAKKEGVEEGKIAGKEIAVKVLKKKYNITSEEKDIDKVLTEIDTAIGKGDAGLKEQITLLQKDKEKLEADVLVERGNAKAAVHDSNLISYFPANVTGDLNNSERLALVKMNLAFEEENGVQVVKKDGVILRNTTTQAAITPKEAIASYFTEKKWITEGAGGGGGRGGGNGGGGGTAGVKKLSAFTDVWKTENPNGNPAGAEFDAALSVHMKATPDFNLNE